MAVPDTFTQKIRTLPIYFMVPVGCLLALILICVVNTPFWDEWELVPIFQHLHAGHFWWSDFWAQHNEHRIFFPTLLLVGLAGLTHWNIAVACTVSLLVASLSFWILIKMLPRQHAKPIWLLTLLSFIWFSPVQAENWLWGWQLEWFMNVLGVVMVMYSLSRIHTNQPRYIVLLVSGGVLALFSLGSGLLILPLAIIALWYLKVAKRLLAVITALTVVVTALYYWNYANPNTHSLQYVFEHPFSYISYVLMYFGRPLSFYHKPAMLLGLLLVVLFIGINLYIYKIARQKYAELLPWIVLGLYSLGAGLLTGVARLSLGTNEAFSSRYTTISSLLLISTIVICWLCRQELQQLVGKKYRLLTVLLVAGCTLLVLGNWAWGVHSSVVHAKLQRQAKTCTSMSRPTDACLLQTYPNAVTVRPRLEYIKKLHWAGY